MKIEDKPKIQLPLDMDEECVEICNTLNRLPNTETYDSCQGHEEHQFWQYHRYWKDASSIYTIFPLSTIGM